MRNLFLINKFDILVYEVLLRSVFILLKNKGEFQ